MLRLTYPLPSGNQSIDIAPDNRDADDIVPAGVGTSRVAAVWHNLILPGMVDTTNNSGMYYPSAASIIVSDTGNAATNNITAAAGAATIALR